MLLNEKAEDTKKHNNHQILSPFGRTDGSHLLTHISDRRKKINLVWYAGTYIFIHQ